MITLTVTETLNIIQVASTDDLNTTKAVLPSSQKYLLNVEAKACVKICLNLIDEELASRFGATRLN